MEQELESSTLDFGRLVHFILTRSVLYGAHLDSGVLWLCLKLDLILECIELTAILFDDSSGVKLTSRVDSPPPRTGCWRFCCCPQPAFSTQDVLWSDWIRQREDCNCHMEIGTIIIDQHKTAHHPSQDGKKE